MQIHIYKNANTQTQKSNFKYAAAMKCKVGPKFVKGGNVLLPYRWSLMEHMSKLHQLAPQPIHGQIFKNLDKNIIFKFSKDTHGFKPACLISDPSTAKLS